MDNQSYIFWFSGTGNSLYAAKKLSAGLGDIPLARMTDEVPAGEFGGDGAIIGFVFPSYYGNLPRAVRGFVEKLNIRQDTYLFAVVTMGGLGQGSVAAMDSAISAKGLRLNYGRGIRMPGNYVVNYNPADPDKSRKRLDKVDGMFKTIAAEIAAGTQSIKKFAFTADNLYKNAENLDAAFFASDKCTSCGVCEKICPVKNIRLEDGKPVWLRRCEHCMACVSWCPTKSIDYGSRTQSRRRYRNPKIDRDELVRTGSRDI